MPKLLYAQIKPTQINSLIIRPFCPRPADKLKVCELW